jgi:biopolymer transport protein ExbD
MGGAELGSSGTKSEPNVVPLCDILLVLLIIFMVITPVSQKGIDIKLPESGKDSGGMDQQQTTGIVLTMEKNKTVKLNTDPISIDMLSAKLRELYAMRVEKTIFIRADETVPYSEVLRLMDIARGAGIEVLAVICDRYSSDENV